MTRKFILCFSLCICISSAVAGADNVQSPAPTTKTPAPIDTTTAALPVSKPTGYGIVVVKILVPQKKSSTDNFMVYPYPLRPPTNDKKLKSLPKKMKEFRAALFNTGYANRLTVSKTYPSLGWRWRYILDTAVEKSHLDFPHGVASAYLWVDQIVPYALPELRKINAAERLRIVRYNKATEFWDLNGVELENEATQAGKHPYDITVDKKNWVARARLPVGTWWVVGTHRLSDLVFYWQEPVRIIDGKITYLNLDEWNALVVQGAW
jgi:hypothetical protein